MITVDSNIQSTAIEVAEITPAVIDTTLGKFLINSMYFKYYLIANFKIVC